jgi:hypothetical protein
VSPVIDSAIADAWPESPCEFDEWYFFDVLPEFQTLHALCNWGATVAEAESLRDVPSGFDLHGQLEHYQPRAVIGDGRRIFLITRDEPLMADFVEECRRRRTRS